ncbi:hypothetical protein FGM00_18140 [Aggregatimonas sangjinii]|uniref:Uncharacterized protein n=1 Tax=Aggregatimonas sangjinii TaxID=2583587 RepID=A0A5B7SYE7_9FLAO|nr:hypothetical protein [Aggregatimonas sangjinii]QCX01941.1 hypothetical protein FGM00_18140 [Aggregatimonas sangjinii]
MNNLNKKIAADFKGQVPSEQTPPVPEDAYYKKLGAYLFLLYQLYLKKETSLEPEIQAALWRRVHFNEDFAFKIRMLQMDYLGSDSAVSEGNVDLAISGLFPIAESEILEAVCDQSQNTIKEYKATVLELLNATP